MNAETTKKLHALVRLCNEIIAEPDTAAKNAQIIKDGLLALCKSENRTGDPVDTCLRLASRASCSAVRIYNLIREVGRGELSADNALHQLVEDYHDLGSLSDDIGQLAAGLEKEEK